MTAFDSAAVSVAALIGLLAASAFFSSTEIAVFSLSREWLDERVAASDRRASLLADQRDDAHGRRVERDHGVSRRDDGKNGGDRRQKVLERGPTILGKWIPAST